MSAAVPFPTDESRAAAGASATGVSRGRGHIGRSRKIIAITAAGCVAIAAVLTGKALAASPSSDGSFRTATAAMSSVTQSLTRSGTIEPVAQAAVAFPISGTIATIGVHAGDNVTTGQTLATLDPTALQSAVASAQANLAQAQLTLQNALTAATTAASTPTTVAPKVTTTTAPKQTQTSQTQAQPAAPNPQLDQAMSDANGALAMATALCSSNSTSQDALSNCLSAEQSAMADMKHLADVEATAAKTTASQQSGNSDNSTSSGSSRSGSSTSASSSSASPSSSSASSSAASRSQGTSGSQGSQTKAPSAQDLVADQAAVDAAAAQVTAAQQNLADATIVSPISGSVAAVNLSAGQQVSAASTTANIVVVGGGGYEVTSSVLVSDISNVKVGEHATVLPDGASKPIDAQVVAIGVTPTTSATTATYPVVLGFNDNESGALNGLHNGAAAAVTIDVANANQAVTVPTSAVHTAGGFHFVMTLTNGKTANVPVQTGAVGSSLTEIKSGLQTGQTVVLADLNQPLPASNTNANRFVGGAGGFGGATVRVGG